MCAGQMWMKRLRHRHTVEYYAAVSRKATVSCATTWMKPEHAVLRETIQSRRFCVARFRSQDSAHGVRVIAAEGTVRAPTARTPAHPSSSQV